MNLKKKRRGRELAYKKEEGKGVVKGAGALCGFDCRNNGETAGSEGDGECDPEARIRGNSSRAEGISHRHLPSKEKLISKQHLLLNQTFFFLPTRQYFPQNKGEEKKNPDRESRRDGRERKRKKYHMPASNCTRPPYPNANPTTIFGSKTPLVWKLHKLSTKAVSANALNPSGVGLANWCVLTWVPGWASFSPLL